MNRLVMMVLVLAGAVLLGGPYYIGTKLEALHRENVAELVAASGIAVETTSYSRGWLKSTASDKLVRSGAACLGGSCEPLKVETTIYHGPIAVMGILDGVAPIKPVQGVMVSRVDLDTLVPEGKLEPALPTLRVTSVVGIGGAAESVIEMKPSEHTAKTEKGELKLELGGFNATFNSRADSPLITGNFEFPSFKMTDASGEMLVEGFSGDVNGKVVKQAFDGSINERLARVMIREGGTEPAFDMTGVAIQIDTSENNGLARSKFSADMKALKAAQRSYGPVKAKGEIRNVNREAMQQMQTDLAAAQTLQQTAPQEAMVAVMQAYQKHLPAIMQSKPELEVSTLSITTPDGETVVALKLAAGGPVAAEAGPMGFLQALSASFSLRIPAVTLWNILDAQMQQKAAQVAAQAGQAPVVPTQDQVGAEVTKLVNSNVLVPELDTNSYTLDASFMNGVVTINGQQLGDLGAVMGMLPQAAAPAPGT